MNLLCILLQVMEFVAVETVSAGTDGMETHVKSGLAQNTLNNERGLGSYLSRPLEI